jgi:membrane associated rhomboid family serine protease
VVTLTVIGMCAVLFLTGPASGFLSVYGTGEALRRTQDAYFAQWGVLPRTLFSGSVRPLFSPLTALFLHGNWVHLLGNIVFLFVFGGWVEERLGSVRYAVFYVATGCAALLCYAAVHAGSSETLVGASGAISGVLGAFLFLFPRARVTSVFPFLFFLPLRFPAWLVLPFWLALQGSAAQGETADDGPGVAHLAHVIGFLIGFGYAWAHCRRSGPGRTRTAGPGTDTVGEPSPATKGESAP